MYSNRAVVLAFVLGLSGCGPSPSSRETYQQEPQVAADAAPRVAVTKPADPKSSIEPYVFEAYNKSDFPKLARKLGASWGRVQSVREGAALKALETGRCDFVEVSEVSDARTTKDNIVVFVDCRNRERVYVSEADLAENRAVVTQSSKTIGRAQAINACAEAARQAATFPSLVDAHTWAGASFTSDKTTGAARVLLDFDATNALGVELPYQANCLYPADSAPELSITAR